MKQGHNQQRERRTREERGHKPHAGCFCWDERGICRWIEVDGQTDAAFTLRI